MEFLPRGTGTALSALVVLALLSPASPAQQQPAPTAAAESAPAFRVADVHPSPPSSYPPFRHDGYLVGDRYSLRQATMLDMIAVAYGIRPQNILGGPSWIQWNRFDVTAMAPSSTPPEKIELMLRSLLQNRFSLVVRQGKAPMPAWVLTSAGKNPKMKPSDGSGKPGCQRQSPFAPSPSGPPPFIEISCHNETMQRFAGEVRALAPDYLDQPVVDSTDLKSSWDFDLRWTPRNALKEAGAAAVPIFDALRNQLGLKLTRGNAPADALTIESVNETPAPNPPDTEKLLPPPPPARLEVSVVRPAQPGEKVRGGFGGDRIDIHAFTLKQLIDFAWFLNPQRDETLVGAPNWLDKDRFDIQAKIAGADAVSVPSNLPRMDRDQFQVLIRLC